MSQHRWSVGMLVMSAALATLGVQHVGWLDRVVLFHKQQLFHELRDLAPININAELQPKPDGYEDSVHWDYHSVLRLLTLIKKSEAAKPVYKSLRRMLQPTSRLMMSLKESKKRFPSIKKDDNDFYYDGYSSEENALPAPPPVPEDDVVLVVTNPVEARLPSARISVKLLRDILEARARAARQMPSTTEHKPWLDFIRNRTHGPTTEEVATTLAPDSTDAPATDSAPTEGDATTAADGTPAADTESPGPKPEEPGANTDNPDAANPEEPGTTAEPEA